MKDIQGRGSGGSNAQTHASFRVGGVCTPVWQRTEAGSEAGLGGGGMGDEIHPVFKGFMSSLTHLTSIYCPGTYSVCFSR